MAAGLCARLELGTETLWNKTRTYSPYGELIEVNSTLQPSAFSLQPCPFGFQSKYYDAETGFW